MKQKWWQEISMFLLKDRDVNMTMISQPLTSELDAMSSRVLSPASTTTWQSNRNGNFKQFHCTHAGREKQLVPMMNRRGLPKMNLNMREPDGYWRREEIYTEQGKLSLLSAQLKICWHRGIPRYFKADLASLRQAEILGFHLSNSPKFPQLTESSEDPSDREERDHNRSRDKAQNPQNCTCKILNHWL